MRFVAKVFLTISENIDPRPNFFGLTSDLLILFWCDYDFFLEGYQCGVIVTLLNINIEYSQAFFRSSTSGLRFTHKRYFDVYS